MIKAINASTKGNLMKQSVGLFHDHCRHLYYGHIKNMPEKFNRYRKGDLQYILIYDEDAPIEKRR